MTYRLKFHDKAKKEFDDLPEQVRERFKAKLRERLVTPHVPAARLSGTPNRYKIKFKKPPLRLVYDVDEDEHALKVMVIGPRARGKVYKIAAKRFL